MNDLISREEAISTIKSMLYQTALNSVEGDEKAALLYADIADNRVETWLKLVDSVDAVPVVQCKDCKYGEPDTNGCGEEMVMCQNKLNPIGDGDWLMPPEFFCADGERREPKEE